MLKGLIVLCDQQRKERLLSFGMKNDRKPENPKNSCIEL